MSVHDEPARRHSHGRARLTDSPWFWLLVFANAALIGVAVIGPKYNQRQGAVEHRFEARREIARRAAAQSAGESGSSETAASDTAADEIAADADASDDYASRNDSAHIVPLKSLALVLVVGNLLAIVLFAWHQVRLMKPDAQNSHPHGP